MNKLLIIILLILIIIFGPFVIIWAINTLFMLGINYGLDTWLAVCVLGAYLHPPKLDRD